jgi:hypothetical protein
VGQAVGLRASLHRLARRTQQQDAPAWPEFAEFECFTCHHTVKNVSSSYYQRGPAQQLQPAAEWRPSWREARGYTGVAGLPAWNPARYVVLRQFIQVAAPETGAQFERDMHAVQTLMAKVSASDPAALAAAATRAAHAVDALLPALIAQKIDAGFAHTLLAYLASDGATIARAGFRVAEQTVMALQTFTLVAHPGDKPVQEAVNQLFQAVETPAAYNPQTFTTHMQALHRLVTR